MTASNLSLTAFTQGKQSSFHVFLALFSPLLKGYYVDTFSRCPLLDSVTDLAVLTGGEACNHYGLFLDLTQLEL